MTIIQQTLFEPPSKGIKLPMPQADVTYYPDFIDDHDCCFKLLKRQINWQQNSIHAYGITQLIPRLNAWYADEGVDYGYSGIALSHHSWIPSLWALKQQLCSQLTLNFNSVLVNYYRNGQDSVSWHSDDESELGINPIIASLSFGESRRFSFKRKEAGGKPVHINLESGSLLLMQGQTQHYWQHQLAKTKSSNESGRINLTFRTVMAKR